MSITNTGAMKRLILFIVMVLLLPPAADSCVGKVLYIGATNSFEGQVLAEVLSSLINERTGSTVSIRYFPDERALYEAVKLQRVDISIDNTLSALQALNRPAIGDVNKAYEVVKTAYEKEKGLIWLKPFGFQHSHGSESPSYTAAVLRVEVLNNFPALPRVIGKVGSALDDESYSRLIKSVESGEKPKKAARDFLKSRKLL